MRLPEAEKVARFERKRAAKAEAKGAVILIGLPILIVLCVLAKWMDGPPSTPPVATVAPPVSDIMPAMSQTDCGPDHLDVCPADVNDKLVNSAPALWGLAQQDERERCRDIRSPKEMVDCLSFLKDKRNRTAQSKTP